MSCCIYVLSFVSLSIGFFNYNKYKNNLNNKTKSYIIKVKIKEKFFNLFFRIRKKYTKQ